MLAHEAAAGRIAAQQELRAGVRVELKQSFNGKRQAGRVSPSQLKRQDGFYIGFRSESPVAGFWHIVFPVTRL